MAISHSGNPIVTAALAEMAMFRQADPSELTLNLYSAELASEGIAPEVVVAACKAIRRTPRRDGETAFPDLGTLLKACREAKHALEQERLAALAATAPKYLLPGEDQPVMTRAEARSFVQRLKADVDARRATNR